MNRPRLADIAKACGVSSATVSRVLNRDPRFSVRQEVRQHILDTASNIGYVPDLSARNLNRRSTHIAGIFGSPYTHLGTGVNDPIFDGIAEILHANDYDVFFEVARRKPSEHAIPFWRFDGAILLQDPLAAAVEELNRRAVPYVCVNENVGKPAAAILSDDLHGMELLVEHLYSLGHRKIAYANAIEGYFKHYSVEDRIKSLTTHARDAGIALTPGFESRFTRAELFLTHHVLEQGATAVVAYDHTLAIQLLGAANAMGLSIPSQFSLACFNDVFPTGDVYPGITAIAVPGNQMGQAAGEALLKAITDDKRPESPAIITIPESLVIRASTGPAPKKSKA